MLSKLHLMTYNGEESLLFWCEGCKFFHSFLIKTRSDYKGPIWKHDGNYENPTFTPSLVIDANGPNRCHLTITNGIITYLEDSKHKLAGTNIEMELW